MNILSEQLTKEEKLVYARDERLSFKTLKNILYDLFGEMLLYENIVGHKVFVVQSASKKIILLTAQITYLGNPHPSYKKRVQLKSWFADVIKFSLANSFAYDVRLIGIYKYKDNVIFVDFDKTNYINRKMHNSSAHVYTNDLYQAMEIEIFTKIDKNKNRITTIKPDKFKSYLLKEKSGKSVEIEELIKIVDNFNKNHFVFDEWIEVDKAILEMKKNNFAQRKQCEWAGFYLEYRFKDYIFKKKIDNYVTYMNDSGEDNIFDFDLKFLSPVFFGDLKSSSIDQLSTMLNDAKHVKDELELYGKLRYLVYEHETIKDKDLEGYPFTKKRLEIIRLFEPDYKKGEDSSYRDRLKAKVKYKKMFIVEINNINFLSLLEEGSKGFHQPNGDLRNVKFKFTKTNIENAIIYSYSI